ncbi:phosphoglycerate dehydrogenase [Rhodospirillales bacterium]|nr:phosphoglycerate dehydrogenase [Rhodospirillales bacterium]
MASPIIKVTSKSFSSHPVLREEITNVFPKTVFNEKRQVFDENGLIQFFRNADGIVVGLEPITDHILEACPNLKIIAKYGVGLDNLDLNECKRREINVGWTGGVNSRGVAEMTLCFMVGLSRNIFFSERRLRHDSDWSKIGGRDLSGQTIGIIGVGNIGKEVIKMLQPFGCNILVNDIFDQSRYYQSAGVKEATKEQIFSTADIISIHTTLDESTKQMVNKEALNAMKKHSYLINVARGGIVDQQALKMALLEGKIAGAAVDVFDVEPSSDEEFLNLPNIYCTPHTAGSSEESVLEMGRSAIGHLVNYFG